MSDCFSLVVFPKTKEIVSIEAIKSHFFIAGLDDFEETTIAERLAIVPDGELIGFVLLKKSFLVFANDPMLLEAHFLHDTQLEQFSKRAYLVYDEVSMTFVVKYRDIEGRSVDYIESDGEIMENDFNGFEFEFEQGDELLHQVFEMVAGVHFYEIDESTPMTLMVVKD
jgi:hypothetical protein